MNNIEKINITDKSYPAILKEIFDAPESFFVWGQKELLNQPAIAIVGTRRCSNYGKEVTFTLAAQLAQTGMVIISGLARGIDEAAHEGVLSVGGKTIGIIGSGLDKQSFYPAENFKLAQKITEVGGTVLSEYQPGTPALPYNFPRRNRIISGLSLGIVVVEAKLKSGALITAEFATNQNREVFAVPGPISHLNSQGPNLLIQKGAKLVTKAEDILEEFPEYHAKLVEKQTESATSLPEEIKILNLLQEQSQSAEELAKKINQPISQILINLSVLELKELIVNNKGLYEIKIK